MKARPYNRDEVSGMLELLGWLKDNRLLVDGARDAFTKAMSTEFEHEAVPSIIGPYCSACHLGLDPDLYKHHEKSRV